VIPVERHQQILALIADRGVVSINELTELLNVSHMTVRRDVQKLEEDGLLLSVSGGVRTPERLASEPSHQDKSVMFNQQKTAIGKLAARHIPLNSCIYLDAGTTTLSLARELASRDDLLIITNDFAITGFLIDNSQCRVIHTGGTLCRENRSCVGEAAAQSLRNLFIDIAFISSSSWSLRGISTPNEDKVAVKRAAIEASSHHILLCDTSKYGRIATHLVTPLTAFNRVITDGDLPMTAQETLASMRIEVLTAGEPMKNGAL
jgi:DeoR/GlpR family transcriptional regulator of sugar metabolism